MHELAIAQYLLEVIQQTIQDTEINKVTKVMVALSDPPMLAPESLEFCFGIIAKDTPCEQAKLVFKKGVERGCYLVGLEVDDGN